MHSEQHSIAIWLIKPGAQAKISMIIFNLRSNLNQQNSNAVLFCLLLIETFRQQHSNAVHTKQHSIAILLIKLGAQAKIPMILFNRCSKLYQQNSNAVLFDLLLIETFSQQYSNATCIPNSIALLFC